MRKMLAGLLLVLFLPFAAVADEPSPADRTGIERAALDYIEGWYTQDAARMERALHPDLVKRRIGIDGSITYLDQMTGLRLVQATRPSPGEDPPPPLDKRRREVTILDVFGNAATAKVDADRWVDYLHLVKWNGDWKILNVLWELRPEPVPGR